jgi:hypothetical protein
VAGVRASDVDAVELEVFAEWLQATDKASKKAAHPEAAISCY